MKLPKNTLCRKLSQLASFSILCFSFSSYTVLSAQIFVEKSTELQTTRFTFKGTIPTGGGGNNSNENYYDGDFGDFNGDGHIDRALGSRYGLLINRGDGWFDYFGARSGFVNGRGIPTAQNGFVDGEDQFQWVDIDNDDDLDLISSGNGNEDMALQINNNGYFSLLFEDIGDEIGVSAIPTLSMTNIDVDGDGDVDFFTSVNDKYSIKGGNGMDVRLLINRFDENAQNPAIAPLADEYFTRGFAALKPWASNTVVQQASAGDIDGDGDMDLLVSRGNRNFASNPSDPNAPIIIEAYFNDGTGHFTGVPTSIPCVYSSWELGMQLGDIDGDGDLDLVKGSAFSANAGLTDPNGNHPSVGHVIAINDGSGGFTDESNTRFTGSYSGDAEQFYTPCILLLDYDYDNDLDIVTTSRARTNPRYVTLYKNDGTGHFTHDTVNSIAFDGSNITSGFQVDMDTADIDGDGVYDLWVGKGGDDRTRIFINSYVSPDGIDPDIPRNVQLISADGNGVKIQFEHPAFAATARHYRVYRSLSPNVELKNRELIKVIGFRHQDEKCFAPVDKLTNAQLNDSEVNLDTLNGTVEYTDASAVPGVTYYYSVVHVGVENDHSKSSAEVVATVPGAGGTDTTGPQLSILSPDAQDWAQYPRILINYADENSGVNLSTLSVSWNKALGDGTAANTNIADRFQYKSNQQYTYNHTNGATLPMNQIATLTVTIHDNAGNQTTKQVAYVPTVDAGNLPTADLVSDVTEGLGPLDVQFDGSGSAEGANTSGNNFADTIMDWEWDFGDGSTAQGKLVDKQFTAAGTYDVTLTVRDNDGGVVTTSRTITVGQSFNAYATSNFTPTEQADPNISGLSADADGDGLPNIAEFYLQSDPKVANAGPLSIVSEGGMMKVRYNRASQPLGVTSAWEQSTDLQNWAPVAPAGEQQIQDLGTALDMEASFNPGGNSKVFYRLKVTEE